MTAAERSRRRRQRRAAGVVVARVEVGADLAEALTEAGYLDRSEVKNTRAIETAMEVLHRRLCAYSRRHA